MTKQTIICPLSGTQTQINDSILSHYILESIHPLYLKQNRGKLEKAINRHQSDTALLAGAIIALLQETELCSEQPIPVQELALINTKLQAFKPDFLQYIYGAIPLIAKYHLDLPKLSLESLLDGIAPVNNWIKLCLAKQRIAVDDQYHISAPTLVECISTIKQTAEAYDKKKIRQQIRLNKQEKLLESIAVNKGVPRVLRAIKTHYYKAADKSQTKVMKSIYKALDYYARGVLTDQEIQAKLAKRLHEIHKDIARQVNEQTNMTLAYIIKDLRIQSQDITKIHF